MVKSTISKGSSPLDKWRQQKDKVLEADAVESEEPAADTAFSPKKSPTLHGASSPLQGSSGDLKYMPIEAPPPKGETTMVPIQAPPPKGEATLIQGESRRQSTDPAMVPGQTPQSKGKATLIQGESRRRQSADPKWGTSKGPPPKGKATLIQGESRRRQSADPKWGTSKGPPTKDEAKMMPGESRRRQSAEPGWSTSKAPPPKDEPTMVPGESRSSQSAEPRWSTSKAPPAKGEATMIPGESRSTQSAEPAWQTSKAPPPKGEATMIPGESRRQSAETDMPPTQGPAPKDGTTTEHIPPTLEHPTDSHPDPDREPAFMAMPDPSDEPEGGSHTNHEATVKNFIEDLRSVASAQGMDFSIIQPDGMKFDFFADSKALRVTFTGREQTVDRIIVREIPPAANRDMRNVDTHKPPSLLGSGSPRRRMLEWESRESGQRQRNAKFDVATIRDANSGALDWEEPLTLKEIETLTPDSQIAMEAQYFDADEGRNWLIKLINSMPAPADGTAPGAPGRELTPVGAMRLVMVLVNCLRSITEH